MKTAAAFLFLLSAVHILCYWYPFAGEHTWQIGMVARELGPWFTILNLAGLAITRGKRRLAFLPGLALSISPLVQLPPDAPSPFTVFTRSLTTLIAPNDPSMPLPLGIRLFRPTGPSPHRILVNIHGGSWQHGGPNEDSTFCTHFARLG